MIKSLRRRLRFKQVVPKAYSKQSEAATVGPAPEPMCIGALQFKAMEIKFAKKKSAYPSRRLFSARFFNGTETRALRAGMSRDKAKQLAKAAYKEASALWDATELD